MKEKTIEKIKKIKTNTELKAFLDTFEEVEGEWDGGNDSGNWDVRGDGESITTWDSYFDRIIENKLNYGSWAGNFYSSGTITYDKTTGIITLEGNEHDSENKIHVNSVNITLEIPDEVIKTSDTITVDATHDGEISVDIGVETGAILPCHIELSTKLEDYLHEKTKDIHNEDEAETFYFHNIFESKNIVDNNILIVIDIEKDRHIGINHEINLNED